MAAPETCLDLRGLPPPEPMTRILDELTRLATGTRLRALLPHEPQPLYPLLEQHGCAWRVAALAPGRCELVVWRRGDTAAAPHDA